MKYRKSTSIIVYLFTPEIKYVGMHVCMHAHVHTDTHTPNTHNDTDVHTHRHTHTQTQRHTQTHTYTDTQTHTHTVRKWGTHLIHSRQLSTTHGSPIHNNTSQHSIWQLPYKETSSKLKYTNLIYYYSQAHTQWSHEIKKHQLF